MRVGGFPLRLYTDLRKEEGELPNVMTSQTNSQSCNAGAFLEIASSLQQPLFSITAFAIHITIEHNA